MNDRDLLFSNVLNAPADEAARLVLADWLEENDEETFGRFVRAGILAAQFRTLDRLDDPTYYDFLRVIAAVTQSGVPARWLSALGIGPSPLTAADWVWDHDGDRVTVRIGATAGVFTRGLLSELLLPLANWYAAAVPALAVWPLERATITNVPGLSYWIDPPDADHPMWRLSAAFTVQTRRRRRGLLRQLGAFFGSEGEPRPLPVGRWAIERSFPDRATLVRLTRDVLPVLLDEVRDAAGEQWV